jgi:uncharacterized LabA/DUF88 family protein
MNRVSFLIDGFNLYHSLVEASRTLNGASTKWLNIHSLCRSTLHIIGQKAVVETIYYFSALADHRTKHDPGTVRRHLDLIRCLKDTGIKVELGRFKEKMVHCNGCKQITRHYEEKETDVAISVKLMEILMKGECDTAVLMTGDTDLAPAVRAAKRLFPSTKICFAFPYGRKNRELAQLAHTAFSFNAKSYVTHQFPDPVVLRNGVKIIKPPSW